VYSKRSAGKLVFYDLKADGEKVQVMADVATSGGDLAAFVTLHNSVKVGYYFSPQIVHSESGVVAPISPTLRDCHPCTAAITLVT
jgi:lysyl-tRNA synthetase class II